MITNIRPGDYTLRAVLNGFRTEQTVRLLTRGEHVWDVGLASSFMVKLIVCVDP